jgi:sigma-E factor negative regulatory protein RseC
MLEQTAEVVAVVPGGARVQAVESSGCGTCGGRGCSTRRLAELFRRAPQGFLVDSALPLAPGDRVVVGIEEGRVLTGALRAYGVPLLAMLGGALLAGALVPGDGPAVAGLLAGGALGWAVGRGGRTERPRVLRREGDISIQLEPYG